MYTQTYTHPVRSCPPAWLPSKGQTKISIYNIAADVGHFVFTCVSPFFGKISCSLCIAESLLWLVSVWLCLPCACHSLHRCLSLRECWIRRRHAPHGPTHTRLYHNHRHCVLFCEAQKRVAIAFILLFLALCSYILRIF